MKFAKLILLLVAVGAGVVVMTAMRSGPDQAPLGAQAQARVVMYSLTTCGYCNIKRAELKAHGIPFLRAGYQGRGVGTPTFEVNGTMLPNNPSLKTIRKHL
jgi:protein-disulfide isomerase